LDSTPAKSPAVVKFESCRWRNTIDPPEPGAPPAAPVPDHCTHRDVLPMAGKEGFSAESWCTDCAFYKAKRVTKKREEQPSQQQDDWRYRY
jgi:hypothetical protein